MFFSLNAITGIVNKVKHGSKTKLENYKVR